MSRQDTLLGGRVLLDQAGAGQRAGIEAVLLAAAVPAEAGEAVLEAGAGVGAASLCLLARVAGTRAVGVEQDAAQAETAARNAAANGWTGRFRAVAGDLASPETVRAAAEHGPYRHTMANPPWFSDGTKPTGQARRMARHADGGEPLALWVGFLAARVSPRGSVTLILPTALIEDGLASLVQAGLGNLAVLPLWPRRGEPAKRIILSARKAGRGQTRLLPGLVLHRTDGRFTEEAEAVLRHAAPLPLG